MIRVTQACLPLLKSQAISRTYTHGRIINMVSMAGLYAMGDFSPYAGSKFAAEAYSTSLRHEMDAFGIQVATVNPSFHTSPLTDSMRPELIKVWTALDPSLRAEYGESKNGRAFHCYLNTHSKFALRFQIYLFVTRVFYSLPQHFSSKCSAIMSTSPKVQCGMR